MKHINLLTTLALLTSMVCTGTAQAQKQKKEQPAPIRVFVSVVNNSNSSGFTDPGQKERGYAVDCIKQELNKKNNRKAFTVVDDKETADIAVEVLDAGYRNSKDQVGDALRPPVINMPPDMVMVYRIKIVVGTDYSTVIDAVYPGFGGSLFGYMSDDERAAIGAVTEVSGWVNENRDKLLARRTK